MCILWADKSWWQIKSEELYKDLHSELDTARKELKKASKNVETKDEQLTELKVKNVSLSSVW